jgi:hypothetical protein
MGLSKYITVLSLLLCIDLSCQNIISVKSGNWSDPTTWLPIGIPGTAANVSIQNGHIIDLDVALSCSNITVGGGTSGELRYAGNTPLSFTVNGNLTVNANAVVGVKTAANTLHSMTLKGHITNNGSFDFRRNNNSLCNVLFSGTATQSISGSGTLTRFNNMTLSMGSSGLLDISVTNFTAQPNFLTLNSGTFKLSTASSVSITTFTTNVAINANSGIWMNAPNGTLSTGSSVNLSGKLTVSNGRFVIGDAANESLNSQGGIITISGGTLAIAGRLDASTGICDFVMSGGEANINTVGSTVTSAAPFHIDTPGSAFAMTGGAITIVNAGGGSAQLGYLNDIAGTVTGGTLQLGNSSTSSSQTMQLQSASNIPALVIGSSNVRGRIMTTPLTILNQVSIKSGTLDANNANLTVGGHWTSTGAFIPGTGSVNFNSASTQSISGNVTETFNQLQLSGGSPKIFMTPVSVAGNFSISGSCEADFSQTTGSLSLKGNLINDGKFTSGTGTVVFNGTSAQSISGASVTSFNHITLNNTAGLTLQADVNIDGTLGLNNGTFNVNSHNVRFRSGSTSTGRIGQITGTGDFSGNATFERFVPGGTTGWALIGHPLSSTPAFTELDDDIVISCPGCPDGYVQNFTSIQLYDETAPGIKDAAESYVLMSSINDLMEPNKGYWVYTGNSQNTTGDITIDFTGTPSKFSRSIPLSYTNYGSTADDGWNLISNPYPSAISWNALSSGVANVDNAIYAFNADLNGGSGGFASFVNGISSPAVSSGGIGNNIPIGQGFYVHATGQATLVAQESHKVSADPTFLKEVITPELMRLKVKSERYQDEAVVYIDPTSSFSFDPAIDAYKMRSPDKRIPAISIEKTARCHVAALPAENTDFSLPVYFKAGTKGSFTVNATQIETFLPGNCVQLYDRYTDASIDLRSNAYKFYDEDTATVARFVLNVSRGGCDSKTNRRISANRNNSSTLKLSTTGTNQFRVWSESGEPSIHSLLVMDQSGRTVQRHTELASSLVIDLDGSAPGIYLLHVTEKDRYGTFRVLVK